jgi:hypothetical protein
MGFPPSNPTVLKLIVDHIAGHDAIEKRAYALFESQQAGSAIDHWLTAERELLNL